MNNNDGEYAFFASFVHKQELFPLSSPLNYLSKVKTPVAQASNSIFKLLSPSKAYVVENFDFQKYFMVN